MGCNTHFHTTWALGLGERRGSPSALAVAIAVTATALLWAGAAQAQDTPCQQEAQQKLLDEAGDLLAKSDTAGAHEMLAEAGRLCPTSAGLVLVAQAFEAAGDCQMARYWYEEALSRQTTGGGDSALLETMTGVTARCPKSGRVRIVSMAEASELYVEQDGKQGHRLALPFEGRMAAGTYGLIATQPGMQSYRLTLAVETDTRLSATIPVLIPEDGKGHLQVRCQSLAKELELGLSGAEPTATPCPHAAELPDGSHKAVMDVDGEQEVVEVTGALNRVEDVRVPEPLTPRQGLTTSDWGWVAFTSGLVLAGAGAGLYLTALELEDDIRSPPTDRVDEYDIVTTVTQKEADETLKRAGFLQLGGWVGVGLGTSALVSAIVLWSWQDDPYDTTIRASVDPNHAGMTASWTF